MAIGPLSGVFNYLQNFGFFDIILPFAIIFSIVWALLSKINLFENKKIPLILGLAISLLAIYPHATGTYQQFDIVNFINTAFPQVGLIILSVVLLMILMGLWKGEAPGAENLVFGTGMVIAVIMLFVVIWRALFPYSSPSWLSFIDDPNLQALLVIILVFGLIVYFVTKDDGSGSSKLKAEKEKNKEFGEGWRKILGGLSK